MKESSKDSREEGLLILFYSWENRSRKVLRFSQSHKEWWHQFSIWFSQSWSPRLLEQGFLGSPKAVWAWQKTTCLSRQDWCQGLFMGIAPLLLPLPLRAGIMCYIHVLQVAQSLICSKCSVNVSLFVLYTKYLTLHLVGLLIKVMEFSIQWWGIYNKPINK
jgi:hypothetical protein